MRQQSCDRVQVGLDACATKSEQKRRREPDQTETAEGWRREDEGSATVQAEGGSLSV